MEVKLVVVNGKQSGTAISIKENGLLIGRGEECNLRPQSSLVSRKHCRIMVGEATATIEDCGSTNGTFLNDERISERVELHNGDQIRVGMLTFEIQISVGIGGRKKPKVRSVQEAAARTADSSPTLADDMDISGWLDEETGDVTATPTRRAPAATGDTMSGKSLLDTSTISPTPEKEDKPSEKSENPPKKSAGKLKKPAKPTTEDSGTAAADALRQFFHRKK